MSAQARLTVLLLAIPPVVLALWLAGWTGAQPSARVDFLWAFFTSIPWTAAWLASAWGYGWALSRWLAPTARNTGAVQIGLGIAVMLVIDTAAGSLGLLQLRGAFGAWIVLIIGLVMLIRRAARTKPSASTARFSWFSLAWLSASPAVAVLVVAACSAPAWLWRTEFGGYDALSYHLQLPREWLADGRMHGMTHNVYSAFPNFMEAAYYHLAVLEGDGIHAAYVCQLLHAGMAVLAAWMVATVASRFAGQIAGFLTFVAVLGTPWVIVTGSLAYDEMTVVLLFACGLLVMTDELIAWPKRALIVGFLVGTACGAKLTSIGFVAVPMAAFALLVLPRRARLISSLLSLAAFVVALWPYLLRNTIETGNPLFPFATSIFGLGHFNPEQAITWSAGHHAHGSIAMKLAALWDQFFRFGIGTNPDPNEPWIAQWSVLPWIGVIGLAVAATSAPWRRHALRIALVLIVQIAFWLFFTHLKSRFLLPAVVPLALGGGLGAAAALSHFTGFFKSEVPFQRLAPRVVAVVLGFLWCLMPVFVFAREPDPQEPAPAARVGRIDYLTGELLTMEERANFASVSSALAINALPPSSRTLLIGEATPFYMLRHITYQTTWDRGPMSAVMREFPDDPKAWLDALKAQGFTNLFVNPSMLQRWEKAGWNDPLITADRVMGAANEFATPIVQTPTGVLYQLK